ncbi:SKA2 protein, partial [Campylorhamphus procurvoides]|nr:SKA2 protein [Campylorhamphus procurvoides]
FQKAKADLDWIQYKLEREIRENLPEDAGAEEDPVAILAELSVLGSRYEALCKQLDRIGAEQQQLLRSIGASVQDTVSILQELQGKVGLE